MISDADLVAYARRGDSIAFRELVMRHYASCWRYARAHTGNATDAEDLVQEALWSAYQALGSYNEEGRFRQWLFSILVNKVRNFQLSRDRHDRRFPVLVGESESEPSVDAPPERDDEIEYAVAQLEPILREAVLLKHAEGLEYREMSALTGIGESALKMRVKRGLEQLRSLLAASNGRNHDQR